MHNAIISRKLFIMQIIKIKNKLTNYFSLNPADPNVRGSIDDCADDAHYHGHARARASFHCDHEDGRAYLRNDNTLLFHLHSIGLAHQC